MIRDDWRSDAACRGMDPALFHPQVTEKRGSVADRAYAQARRVCAVCPVADQCLACALTNDQRDGMWGGTTPRQRRGRYRTFKVAS